MYNIEFKKNNNRAELIVSLSGHILPKNRNQDSAHAFKYLISDNIINSIIKDAEQKFNIYPVGIPQLQIQKKYPNGNTLLVMTFDMLPHVTLPDTPEKISIDIEESIVHPHEIKAQLHKILRSKGELISITTNRLPEPGDILIIDIDIRYNNKILYGLSQKNFAIQYKIDSKYSYIIDAVRTLTIGVNKSVNVDAWNLETLDAKYKKFIDINLTLVDIKKEILPKTDDNFAKSLGISSLDALYAAIYRKSLGVKIDRAKKIAMDQLIKKLLECNSFAIPETMLDLALSDLKNSMASRLLANECPKDDIEWELSLQENFIRNEAEDTVRKQIILLAAARKYGISISQDDIYKYFHKINSGSHSEIDKLYGQLINSDKVFILHDAALSHKTFEFLYAKANKRMVDSHGRPVETII